MMLIPPARIRHTGQHFKRDERMITTRYGYLPVDLLAQIAGEAESESETPARHLKADLLEELKKAL